jgi:hypothetical protein
VWPVALPGLHASRLVREVHLSPAAIAARQHILSVSGSQCHNNETVIGKQCSLRNALIVSQCSRAWKLKAAR